jgi:anti-sigma28 factor (negative regulator of flagellin synthesis)
MKITETKPVTDVSRIAASEPSVAPPPKDRVTVSASRGDQASISSIQATATRARSERLKDLETQVRAGNYYPDPSQVADQIMNDADLDARMQALLQH